MSELPNMEEASKEKFEVFYWRPSRGTFSVQADVRGIGESYSITLTFDGWWGEKKPPPDLRKDVKVTAGLLEITTGYEVGFGGSDGGWCGRGAMRHLTESQVPSSGRTFTMQVPKAPALGFFDGGKDGKLVCPGLIVNLPSGLEIHVAVIDTPATSFRLRVEKHKLSVLGATLSLEADGELRYTFEVQDPSAAKEFKVEMERRMVVAHGQHSNTVDLRRVLVSSKEGSYVTGTWTPAKPSRRKVLLGRWDDYWDIEKALEDSERSCERAGIGGWVIGDPAPGTEYRIWLLAKKGWMKGVQEADGAVISFHPV